MNYKGIFLMIMLIIIIYYLVNFISKEGYSNYSDIQSSVGPILNSYPHTGGKNVNANNYNDIWWYNPIFKVGSYAQITNNLRYQRNPDDGDCITAEFCGTLYKDNQLSGNYIFPLPPVPDTPGTRINYYRTPENLFLGPQPNPQIELPAF
jgi:hypothetical protein